MTPYQGRAQSLTLYCFADHLYWYVVSGKCIPVLTSKYTTWNDDVSGGIVVCSVGVLHLRAAHVCSVVGRMFQRNRLLRMLRMLRWFLVASYLFRLLRFAGVCRRI